MPSCVFWQVLYFKLKNRNSADSYAEETTEPTSLETREVNRGFIVSIIALIIMFH